MKNNKTLIAVIGGLALLGVGYFLLRKFSKKGEMKADEIRQQGQDPIIDQPADSTPVQLPTTTGSAWTNIGNAITNFLSNYQDYEVVTKTSSLNVRQRPDAQSKIIGSLTKGSTVRAKASGVKGWFAVSDNDKDIKGYVSQTYLKAKSK